MVMEGGTTKAMMVQCRITNLPVATIEVMAVTIILKTEDRNIRLMVAHTSASIATRVTFLILPFGFTRAINMAVNTIRKENAVGQGEVKVTRVTETSSHSRRLRTSLLKLIALGDQSIRSMDLKKYLSRFFLHSCTRKKLLMLAEDLILVS